MVNVQDVCISDKELYQQALEHLYPMWRVVPIFDSLIIRFLDKMKEKSFPQHALLSLLGQEVNHSGSDLEQDVCEIVASILSLRAVNKHDNLFDLGADSIDVSLICEAVEHTLQMPLKEAEVYAHPTASKLATFLVHRQELQLPSVIFPEEYVLPSVQAVKKASYDFELSVSLTQVLRRISLDMGVQLSDVLTGLYAYLLGKVTGQPFITLQSMFGRNHQVRSLCMEWERVKEVFELFGQVHEQQVGKRETQTYSLQQMKRIRLDKAERTILPFIYDQNALQLNVELVDVYDLTLAINMQHNQITFVCEYNEKRLQSEKVRDILRNYVRLMQFVGEGYTPNVKEAVSLA